MTEPATPQVAHPLDEAVAVTQSAPGQFRASTHPAYGNMVGPFGGITAATVLAALQQHPDALGDPLALTVNFLAPISDGAFTIDVTVLRTNRTNQHLSFIARQDDAVVSGTAVFGIRRDTLTTTELRSPEVDPPAAYAVTETPSFIKWTQQYQMRFAAGGLESFGTASDSSESIAWIRDAPERPLDFPGLMAMSDSFFPRVFLRTGAYSAAGTVTMTTYFHATAAELAAQGTAPVLTRARAARFSNGHYDQTGYLWGANRELLATTHQLTYFKDPQG